MGIIQIIQLINLAPGVIASIETVFKGKPGRVKREAVRTALLSSIAVTDVATKLSVKDQKQFTKGLDKIIDGIVGMLNSAEWK